MDEGEPGGEPSFAELVREGGDPGGIVERHTGREHVCGVEAEAEAIVGDRREELFRLVGERRHGAGGPGHQLGEDPDPFRFLHGQPVALRGGTQGRSALLRAARPRVDDQQIHAERVAGDDRLHEELTRPAKRGRIPRRHVPDIGEMSDAGPEPARPESGPELLDLRLAVSRAGPCSRVRDEDLEAVRPPAPRFFQRPRDASMPAPDVGAQDHA